MREALVIFRKDVKHLWPVGITVSALVVLHGWFDLRMEQSYLKTINGRVYNAEPFLLFLAWWCLAGMLVQQERTAGDRQYWLTRPISRISLLAAKALSLVIFISMPSFLSQTVVLILTGFSPAHYLGALLWNQMLLFLYFPAAAAVAAVTRNFRQYAITSLATGAILLFLLIFSANEEGGQWGGFDWVRDGAVSLVFLSAMAAVLAVMYTSRRTLVARLIGGIGLFVFLLLMVANFGWRQAFAVTAALAGSPDEAARRIQVTFDASAGSAVPQPESVRHAVRVAIPVRVAGIPPGRQLMSERVSIAIRTPGATTWKTGWRYRNELAKRTVWRNSNDWLQEDGPYWLSFDLPTAYFERVKDKPASLLVNIALSEFTDPAVTELPIRPREYPVPGVGHCGVETIVAYTRVSCVAPFERRVATDFRIQPHNGGQRWETSGCCTVSYGPLKVDGNFSVWSDAGSIPSGPEQLLPDDQVAVEVRRPLSHFEREIEIRDIRLARYGGRQ
jgi:hypothetical protein